ncbi:MAG: hypothetical protein LBV50_10430 [Novosphingobium sp.]|jgi:hypothetical protein|nr:hypothetical protein [Novosphingobium sp.]
MDKAKWWIGSAFPGFVIIAAVLFLRHDLRGWTPDDLRDSASIVQPTLAGRPAFAIGACVPGTISPREAPSPEEYAGSATLTVLTCRSRSSAVMLLSGYVACAAAAGLFAARRRRRGVEP